MCDRKKNLAIDLVYLHITRMQRRPLSPIDKDPDLFRTPFERILDIFNKARADNRNVLCTQPLFHSVDYAGLFQMIGFDDCPIHPKARPHFLCPDMAPEGQHPTGFLQFGARVESKRHVVFEMGDYHYLVRFDFKEFIPENESQAVYQIDELEIHDGDVRYDLDCEDEFYRTHMTKVMGIVGRSMAAMARDDHDYAKAEFANLQPLVQDLDEISAKMQAQIAQQEMDARMAANNGPHNRC